MQEAEAAPKDENDTYGNGFPACNQTLPRFLCGRTFLKLANNSVTVSNRHRQIDRI
jgi:hypothetical protein